MDRSSTYSSFRCWPVAISRLSSYACSQELGREELGESKVGRKQKGLGDELRVDSTRLTSDLDDA